MLYALEFLKLYQCCIFEYKFISLMTVIMCQCSYLELLTLDILIWSMIIQILVIPKLIFIICLSYVNMYIYVLHFRRPQGRIVIYN